ncbi:MAG: amino acid adenylation domain-containing protein, partial [Acidobacteriota bacterium]
ESICRTQQGQQTPALLPISRDRHLLLSFAQQRLWFLDQLEPNSPTYNMPTAVRINGVLDVIALQKSFNQIITRHEVLRTTFACVNDQPVQVIADTATILLPVVELTGLPEAQRQQQAYRLAIDESQQPFNLSQGPLLRAMLLRTYEEEHILLFTMHHIVSDGWSTGIFIEEMSQLYQAFVNDQPCTLPALPIQYADFAHWQREWLQAEVLQAELAYWQHQLADVPMLNLPTDHTRPAIQTFQGSHQTLILPTELSTAMQRLSRDADTTLFMTLLSVFYVLLYRYSGQCDISLGTPIANRNHIEIEKLIGFFVNTLVLRTKLSADESFKSLLQSVREVALAAYTHQDLPFEKLVEELQPERDLSRTPLFQVMFALHSAIKSLPLLTGLSMSTIELENNTAKFDLTLSLIDSESGLLAELRYNTDLFDATTITRMLEHFQNLLVAITANPSLPIADLPLLSAMERRQLLVDWNDTKLAYPQDLCIHQLFEAQVERTPQAIAVIFDNQQLTYLELNQRANQLAHHLLSLGVKPDSLVAIYLDRSLDIVVALLAVLKSGAAYLPLDTSVPTARITSILNDAQVHTLLTQQHFLANISNCPLHTLSLDKDWPTIAQHCVGNPDSLVTADNLAYVIFTSGSTGRPKGVAIEHKQLVNYLSAIVDRLEFHSDMQFATVSTFAADLGNTVVFPSLCIGGCLHIISQQRTTDAKALSQYFSQHNIDCLKIVPSHLKSLLSFDYPHSLLPRQRLVLGGEAASWDLIAKLHTLSPHCVIHNHYGPTESTVGVLTYQTTELFNNYNSIVPLGQPLANTQIFILDQHMHPVPIGVTGELHIGGNGLARGYLNRAELTAEKFIPNPFSTEPGSRLYRSGDLARFLPDGNIEFIGRIDN